jgi:hypothetical protein
VPPVQRVLAHEKRYWNATLPDVGQAIQTQRVDHVHRIRANNHWHQKQEDYNETCLHLNDMRTPKWTSSKIGTHGLVSLTVPNPCKSEQTAETR